VTTLFSRPIRVLFTEKKLFEEELRDHVPENWDCRFDDCINQYQLRASIASWEPEVVFTRLGLYFDRFCFEASVALRVVVTPTTGLDHIDLVAGVASGVDVLSLRGQKSFLVTVTSTAEHAWALLLAASRSLIESARRPVDGEWSRAGLEIHQLAGTQLGLIGLGRIGLMLASYGHAFRMKVAAADPHVGADAVPDYVEIVGLEQLIRESDYIILAASFSEGDKPILRAEHFEQFKIGTVIVNVSRGELIEEEALAQAIKSGRIRASGCDVLAGDSRWPQKGIPVTPVLELARSSSRVIVTPHVGGYAIEAVLATRRFMIAEVIRWLESKSVKAT
jgi:D-3-phosphoglycerate dehydrogenase